MNPSLILPVESQLAQHWQRQQPMPYAYSAVGASADGQIPAGYDHDHEAVCLGVGELVFQRAKQAIARWQMFPRPWTRIYPDTTPIQENRVVLVLFRLWGLWWWKNSARIVYVIDEPTRFGFAYGTQAAHIEQGEEIFLVEMRSDGSVWYSIQAFSRPNRWYVWLAYPIARRYQRLFRQDSFHAMAQTIKP